MKQHKINIPKGHIEIDFKSKCDLCGYSFKAIHKNLSLKANCPNCKNEVYTDAFNDRF